MAPASSQSFAALLQIPYHILHNLPRQLGQQLLRQQRRTIPYTPKRHKLHYIPHRLIILRIEQTVIAIEPLHIGEVGSSHPDDDDGDGDVGVGDDEIDGLLHVVDLAVSED